MAKFMNKLIDKVDTLSYEKGKLLTALEILLSNPELINDEYVNKELKELVREVY